MSRQDVAVQKYVGQVYEKQDEEEGAAIESSSKENGEERELLGLDFSNQAIRNIMGELFKYSFLTILRLDGNNLVSIPKEIGTMKNLVTLDVSRNKLQTIPAEIGKLISLRELLLYRNQLCTLPHELGQLYLLSRLQLDENPFCEPIRSILCDGGTPAVMYYLCEMCPVGPPPDDREWATIFEYSNTEAVGYPFTVFSYNVLSRSYASKQHYGYVPTWVLSWDYRKDLILREIASCMSDIICLQEVELDKYENFFKIQLSSIGNYKGLYWPKTRARTMDEYERMAVDGCAIFWKGNVFNNVATHCVDFQQLCLQDPALRKVEELLSRLTSKDNIAVIALLEHIDTSFKLLVVNTHLHWDPFLNDIKLVQSHLLTTEIQRLLLSWGCCNSLTEVKRFPIIFAGDLNSTPTSSVYNYLDTGSVPLDHPDLKPYPYRKLLLENFKHEFDFKSVYSHVPNFQFTNYTPTFKDVIDYIWYSPRSLVPMGALKGIDPAYYKNSIGFPDAHNPSDHIFLFSSFAFSNIVI